MCWSPVPPTSVTSFSAKGWWGTRGPAPATPSSSSLIFRRRCWSSSLGSCTRGRSPCRRTSSSRSWKQLGYSEFKVVNISTYLSWKQLLISINLLGKQLVYSGVPDSYGYISIYLSWKQLRISIHLLGKQLVYSGVLGILVYISIYLSWKQLRISIYLLGKELVYSESQVV